MIRACRSDDIDTLMQIWLDANLCAHSFIPKTYWTDHYEQVKHMLPQAELYVYEEERSGEIEGFIGLTEDYIAGIFVREQYRSKGIGKQLLNYAKSFKQRLSLNVYQKNERAVHFYQREHFVVQSEHTDEATGENEYVMIWRGDHPCSLGF